ncbi:U32 family peptidase [Aquaspirillum sp. LM1]|uniref:U32 family peptidase n=1 Tax=Aquaspirillum sp. LM1 TaxID=1938604 RepID=UPI001C0AB4BA|nr:U32 family peptidase [Aquaspirillum sp. LM1]
MEMTPPFLITLGPLLYYWPRQTVQAFYREVAASAVDVVYLGETVCLRRHVLRPADWLEIAAELAAAGKQVVLSTPTLVESGAAIQLTHKLAGQDNWLVEAGDLGAIRARGGRPFVAGPHLNAYHGDTLRWLAGLGACRFVAPLELNRTDLAALLAETPPGLQCEVMVWGRMPLAFSARCFTARHFDLSKDDCVFRCIEHPDGLAMRTQEDSEFLTLNGVQTQSGAVLDLLDQASELAQLGVAALRVSPQSQGTLQAIAALAAVRAGQPVPSVMLPAGIGRCNGYWWGESGNVWRER